jgi:hypothetical protein
MKPKKVDLLVQAHVAYLWLHEEVPQSVLVGTWWGLALMTVVGGDVDWSAS